MTVGPIGDLGETSTAISQQAQFLAQQNELRTQEAQAATDLQARLADRGEAQQATLDRQAEREAQLVAQQEAQQRADANQAALEAFGIQQAQLQDVILADQALEASQEVTADQNRVDQQQALDRQLDQSAVNAFLNENTTVSSVQEALQEFQQMEEVTGLEVSSVTVTLTQSGSEIDTQL
ncbi:hypothetical protein LWF15_04560 [Kineosporia rhizophila]|uniref:hypothetical protein n=1 Tax=Kineosporia TaxID=49184 RepID=UPI001E5B880A|nr:MULTISPECIES: hypothetical protein [Kineosporia]MCE0534772.1 hypothetical protein [Kineosporia rhizophila]GLY19301.1 hypothetical protein Kisp01_63150 [Kineosporia sp. NBRC 101677]